MEAELRAIRKIVKELNEIPARSRGRVMDYVDAWLQETAEAATAPVAAEDEDDPLDIAVRKLCSDGKSTG